jgi:magnesium chelatase family protein
VRLLAFRCSPSVLGLFRISLGFKHLRVTPTLGKKATHACPCGRAGLVAPSCRCQPAQVQRYRARISGPLLDRIDLQLELPPVAAAELTATQGTNDSSPVLTSTEAQRQVCAARRRQLQRQGKVNARLGAGETLENCHAVVAGRELLQRATAKRGYSARSQHRILRVARSIADLDDVDEVTAEHVGEALALRWGD